MDRPVRVDRAQDISVDIVCVCRHAFERIGHRDHEPEFVIRDPCPGRGIPVGIARRRVVEAVRRRVVLVRKDLRDKLSGRVIDIAVDRAVRSGLPEEPAVQVVIVGDRASGRRALRKEPADLVIDIRGRKARLGVGLGRDVRVLVVGVRHHAAVRVDTAFQ